VVEATPEHQPTSLDRSDLHEPAEILPGENGTVVTPGDQRYLHLTIIPD
jgi:hypothetical protein